MSVNLAIALAVVVLVGVAGLIRLARRRRANRKDPGSFKYPPDHPLHTWTKPRRHES